MSTGNRTSHFNLCLLRKTLTESYGFNGSRIEFTSNGVFDASLYRFLKLEEIPVNYTITENGRFVNRII